jgi:DNA-binding MarR family transcriptional regulator
VNDQDVRRLRKQFKSLQLRLRQEFPSAEGLTRTELQVLALVRRSGGLTPRDVGAELGMASSNVAAALRVLESRALVEREPDPGDRRRTRLTATAAGSELVMGFRTERDTWLGRAISATLSAEELALLLRAGDVMERLARFEPTW